MWSDTKRKPHEQTNLNVLSASLLSRSEDLWRLMSPNNSCSSSSELPLEYKCVWSVPTCEMRSCVSWKYSNDRLEWLWTSESILRRFSRMNELGWSGDKFPCIFVDKQLWIRAKRSSKEGLTTVARIVLTFLTKCLMPTFWCRFFWCQLHRQSSYCQFTA